MHYKLNKAIRFVLLSFVSFHHCPTYFEPGHQPRQPGFRVFIGFLGVYRLLLLSALAALAALVNNLYRDFFRVVVVVFLKKKLKQLKKNKKLGR